MASQRDESRGPAAGEEPAAGAAAASSGADVDVELETVDGEVAHDVAAPAPEVAVDDGSATEETDALRRERDEYLALAQRARADFENFRRRAAQQATDAERRGKSGLAKGLIPVVDNLERALLASGISPDPEERAREAADQPSEVVSAHEALGRGVALVLGELQTALNRAGIETFDPVGERFDPESCEALSTRPAEDGRSGEVIETLEKGYRMDGMILRPARVIVGA